MEYISDVMLENGGTGTQSRQRQSNMINSRSRNAADE